MIHRKHCVVFPIPICVIEYNYNYVIVKNSIYTGS